MAILALRQAASMELAVVQTGHHSTMWQHNSPSLNLQADPFLDREYQLAAEELAG